MTGEAKCCDASRSKVLGDFPVGTSPCLVSRTGGVCVKDSYTLKMACPDQCVTVTW